MRTRVLSEHLNITEKDLGFTIGKHGKPQLKGDELEARFNISHTGDLWAIALSPKNEIGLDIERHRPRKNMNSIMAHYFHSQENEAYLDFETDEERAAFFFKLWTQKEAYAKYLGRGLNYDFSAHSFINALPDGVTIITKTFFAANPHVETVTMSIASDRMLDQAKIEIKGNVIEGLMSEQVP